MAALLVSVVLDAVRDELHDHGTPPRWSDGVLIALCTDAREAIVGVRPEALYVDGEIITEVPPDLDPTATPATLDLEILSKFKTAAMAYICLRCLFQQKEHAANVTAANGYLALYVAELK